VSRSWLWRTGLSEAGVGKFRRNDTSGADPDYSTRFVRGHGPALAPKLRAWNPSTDRHTLPSISSAIATSRAKRLVDFSCKRRGFCGAQRMTESAALLVYAVLLMSSGQAPAGGSTADLIRVYCRWQSPAPKAGTRSAIEKAITLWS
jgi:hypothetical protein